MFEARDRMPFLYIATECSRLEIIETHFTYRPFPGIRQCKFRHWISTTLHPSTHVTNIPNLSISLPGSCDGFHANAKFAAVPLATSGGHVAVIDVSFIR